MVFNGRANWRKCPNARVSELAHNHYSPSDPGVNGEAQASGPLRVVVVNCQGGATQLEGAWHVLAYFPCLPATHEHG
jgi:hypothetical protein